MAKSLPATNLPPVDQVDLHGTVAPSLETVQNGSSSRVDTPQQRGLQAPLQEIVEAPSPPLGPPQTLTLEQVLQQIQEPPLSPAAQPARALLAQMEKEPPTPRPPEEIPLTQQEAVLLSQLKQESEPLAARLLACLQKQHPEAEWLASQTRLPIKEARDYQYNLVSPWEKLCQAREVAHNAKEHQRLKLEGGGITALEGQALYFLSRQKPEEAQALEQCLAQRGDKAHWMSQQCKQGDIYGDGVSAHFVEKLNSRWTARASAYQVLGQLEKSSPPEIETPAVPPAPTLAVSEAKALLSLRKEDPEAAEKMQQLLARRNVSDGWMARQLLKRNDDGFSNEVLHHLENQRAQHIEAYQLLQNLREHPPQKGEWALSPAELSAFQTLQWMDEQAGQDLLELLSRRHPGVGWAVSQQKVYSEDPNELKQHWDQVEKARKRISHLDQAPPSTEPKLTLEEMTDLELLARLSPEDGQALGKLFEGRSPMAAWMVRQYLDHPTRVRPALTAQELQNLEMSWNSLQQADQELAALQKPDQPTPGVPVKAEQDQALRIWRREFNQENNEKSRQMRALLLEKHPDAGWFLHRLENRPPETDPEAHYGRVLQDYQKLVQGRTDLDRAEREGLKDLDFARFDNFHHLRRVGGEKDQARLQAVLENAGPRALLPLAMLSAKETVTSEDFFQCQEQTRGLEPALQCLQGLQGKPQNPVPEGALPCTVIELESLLQLRQASWAVGHQMGQILQQRSDFFKHLPQDLKTLGDDPQRTLSCHHDAWLLQKAARRLEQDPTQPYRSRSFHLGAWEIKTPFELTSPQQAERVVSLWHSLTDFRGQSPKPDLLRRLASMPGSDRLPPSQLEALALHIQAHPQSQPVDEESLRRCTRTWEVDPQLPTSLADQLAESPLLEKLQASLAWRLDPENYASKLEEVRQLKNPELVAQLPPEQLPSAIELMQGRALDPGQRIALYAGLKHSDQPMAALLSLKGAAFKECLEALNPLFQVPEGEHPRSPYEYRKLSGHGWENRGAVALALTFRGSWKQWLDAQARIKGADGEPTRSLHDAVDLLPLRPAPQLQGLDTALLQNATQPLADLQLLVGRWNDLTPEERQLPFPQLLEVARRRAYPDATHTDLAVEACRWGVPRQDYARIEQRFLASQQVPSPFQNFEKQRWSEGDLVGRFLPRSDPRGLFLGNHTGCCQHPYGAGHNCAWHGQESPNGGFFVLENRQGEVVAQSWAWLSQQGGVVFDNVEGYRLQGKASQAGAIYEKAAKELVGHYPQVTMGTHLSKLPTAGWPEAGPQTQTPIAYDGYRDSEEQVLLARA